MTHSAPIQSFFDATLIRLRGLTQRDVMDQWRICPQNLSLTEALDAKNWSQWAIAEPNDRRHVAWDKGELTLWMGQSLQVPQDLDGYPLIGLDLRIDLTWWAILAQIYVQGQLVQEGDLYDCFGRILLGKQVQPGDCIDIAIRLVSPGHDPGALVKSVLWFEPESAQTPDPGMVADEMAIVQSYVQRFKPDDLDSLEAIVQTLNWETRCQPDHFHRELAMIRDRLKRWSPWIQTRKLYWTGHAHLDMAWLWPVSETWEVAERTFASVLALIEDFPELRFCHSSPALYAWIEQNRPHQFAQIQARVQSGQWEIAAGLWIEPEFNLVNGESLVRQVLYGQRYCQEKFGVLSATAWLPDSFGFCWQLPQILKQGGIDYFLTQKLRWNDTTEFPYEAFLWRSPDGTGIYSLMLPPIGTRIDPVKMTEFAQSWEIATGSPLSYWLPGLGDHGGGPTRDMLEVARRWDSSPIIPKLQSTSAETFCRETEALLPHPPVWEDELYLEFHRGCYTSHADQKRYNRDCEAMLMEAELFAAIAALLTNFSYPKADLEEAWKQVLFNQFHDILPGSAIPEVYVDANRDWQAALTTGRTLRTQAWEAIAQQISPSAPDHCHPLVVFNGLNWSRSEWVVVECPDWAQGQSWEILTPDLHPVKCYLNATGQLCFWVDQLPSVGFRLYWFRLTDGVDTVVAEPQTSSNPPKGETSWQLENEFLRVTLQAETGELSSVFDKALKREILSGPGNELQFFRDQGQYWDAWNIDPSYAEHRLQSAQLKNMEWIHCDRHEQRIRVTFAFENSLFLQDYVLYAGLPYLILETQVDWQSDHILVKAAFPLAVTAEQVTCEMPCGAINRPTLPNPKPLDAWQTAKWEIPALQWADLSDESDAFGVSLLNDCKYGYDAQPSQLRLTLLRGATWPDPNCDRGRHRFRYALYPHAGTWKAARTTHKGYEFNRPLCGYWPKRSREPSSPTLPLESSFLSLPADHVILMALKQSEASAEDWIVRYYECHGDSAKGTLSTSLNLQISGTVDGLERSQASLSDAIAVKPWQITAVRFASR